jgi:group I intron endonuclease
MSSDKPTRKPYGFVYLVTNKSNQKIYVGQTRREVNRRWHQHASKAKKWVEGEPIMPICKAIRKYGRENFTVITLHAALSREDLDRLEALEIENRRAMDRATGYNQKQGGLDGRLTDECIEKIANKFRGKTLKPETRAKITAWAQSPEGRASGLKGRLKQGTFSQDTIEKLREAGKRKDHTAMFAAARLANIGRIVRPETRAKLSEAFKGKPTKLRGVPLSEAHKVALREAWKQRREKYGDELFSKQTRETLRAKVTASWTARRAKYGSNGRTADAPTRPQSPPRGQFSQETRARMSESAKKRWARTKPSGSVQKTLF